MKLIADSGSTKTDWVLTDGAAIVAQFQTEGINPFHQSEDEIRDVLGKVVSEMGKLLSPNLHLASITFYGSGVRPELEAVMERLIGEAFPGTTVEAHGDLLGAARALCGNREGIACILGTGANSCLYDGRRIVSNTPPLGYILGDEGSGAVLGRRFLNALYKGRLPESVVTEFEKETGMTMADVIARVYRQPMANRYLASLSPFIGRHAAIPQVHGLVVENFRDFFRNNIMPYQRRDLPVGFVGSIAYYYKVQLQEAAEDLGYRVGRVLKSPIEGLVIPT